jgi:pimeloyl-ACP methyl ester carboxylesterase
MTHSQSHPGLAAAIAVITAASFANPSTSPQRFRAFSVKVTGSGRAILLIPGLESSGDVWTGVSAHLSVHYQVHVLTLAGFAGEPSVPGLRLDGIKDQIIAYVRENQLDRPVIIGHSLGAFLALWIAASAPELPEKVIAVDGVPFLPALMDPHATAESSRDGAEKMRATYKSMDARQLAAVSKMALSAMITDPKSIDLAVEWARRSDPAFVAQAVYDLMTTDLRDDIRRIRVPVLTIGAAKAFAGDEARLAAVRAAYERQIAAIPDHKLFMDPNALHFIMLDDPDYLLRTMDRFLEAKEQADAR